jgi:hypothetical protein
MVTSSKNLPKSLQHQFQSFQIGANPQLENNLGLTPWINLSKLNETIELECLQIFVDISQIPVDNFSIVLIAHSYCRIFQPPIDLIFNAIEHNHMNTYGYLLSILHEELKTNSSSLSRLLRTALRSSNTVSILLSISIYFIKLYF